jgi:hypothetical protein
LDQRVSDAGIIGEAYQRVGADLFGAKDLRAELLTRDPGERAFFTLVACGAQIDNGGVSQLFFNSTGELIYEVIAGAQHLGLERHAAILREATSLFPGGIVPLDWDEREAAWNVLCEQADTAGDGELDERISALDQRWHALAEELATRLAAFARLKLATEG